MLTPDKACKVDFYLLQLRFYDKAAHYGLAGTGWCAGYKPDDTKGWNCLACDHIGSWAIVEATTYWH